MTENEAVGQDAPQAEAMPFSPDSQTGTPLAVRDEQGRFLPGNPGGPGRPAGRRDRINAALEALREHYKTPDQAGAIKAFVRDVLEGIEDNDERLELLRLLLPKESTAEIAADVRVEGRAMDVDAQAVERALAALEAALHGAAYLDDLEKALSAGNFGIVRDKLPGLEAIATECRERIAEDTAILARAEALGARCAGVLEPAKELPANGC